MIDKATVDLILDTADIVEVVSDFVTLKRRGVNYVGLCPFHNDRTPSFYVSKAKGLCKCFSCGEGGSAVGFIMKHEQMTYPEALKYLANKYHIEIHEREQTNEEKESQEAREAMFMLNEWACKFFEDQLHGTTEGQEVGLTYFNDRGFSTATIKKFRLGYSPEDRSALYRAATAQGFSPKLLFETGLCVDDNRGGGIDRYRGRVIFPIINIAGKIVAFGGRTLKKEKTIAKYVNSPESIIYSKRRELYGLYNAKREISKQHKCFIVEGYADVISMHQSGFENVIASSGTALTDEHVHKIHRFTENVTEMFDGDEAGIKAAFKGIDKLLSQGLNMKVLLLPDNDDPDSYSRKHSASEIQQYIDNNEEDFISFKSRIMLNGTDRDPIKKAQAVEEVTKSIALIPSEVTRNIYAKECSDLFAIGEDVILRSIAKHIKSNREEQFKEKEREKNRQQNAIQQSTPTPPPTAQEFPPSETPPPPPPGYPEQTPQGQQIRPTTAQAMPRANALYPYESAIIKYLVKYGMCGFTMAYYDGNEVVNHCATVIEFVNNELAIDNILFSTPVFKRIFDISMGMVGDFYNDLAAYEAEVASNTDARVAELSKAINPVGHSIDSLKQEEERIKAQVSAENNTLVSEFRIRYLEKRLCSHPQDDVRDTAADLASEKYTLSKIHTEYAHIPTDFDKLETLIPAAIYNWKNAIIEQRIKDVQHQMISSQGDDALELLKQLQYLYSVRSQISKLIGERVITPK